MTATPREIVATQEHAGRTCPYCRFSFKAGVQTTECGACHTLHHSECWADNQGCTVMGCAAAPGEATQTPPAPPPPAAPGAYGAPGGAAPLPVPPQPSAPGASARPPSVPVAEFADRMRSLARTPMAVAAAAAAGIAALVMVVVGFIVAIAAPDASLLGSHGIGIGLFRETMRDAVATTHAGFGIDAFRFPLLPIVFVLAPLLGAAVGAHRNARRTEGLSRRQRLLAGAATGLPLALIALILSALAGNENGGFSAGSVFFYALLLGGLGGALGARRAIGRPAAGSDLAVPPAAARWLRIAGAAAKPLAVVLLLGCLIAIAAWEVQVIRGEQSARGGRNVPTAAVETLLYGGENGIQAATLGMLAKNKPPSEGEGVYGSGVAFPPNDGEDFDGYLEPYRVFAYTDAYPPPVYVFGFILLIGGVVALALYAGYSAAMASGAATPGLRAAYGALVGVVWAMVMIVIRAFVGIDAIDGDSLFVSALLMGSVAGALGGLASRPAVTEEHTVAPAANAA